MKPLDFNSILNIFEDTPDPVDVLTPDDSRLDHPYVRMGLIVRGMDHFKSLSALMLVTRKEDWERIADGVTNKYYNRLYHFIVSLDLSQSSNVSHWLKHGRPKVEWTLNKLRKYYEVKEQYERCGKIKDVLNFIEEHS